MTNEELFNTISDSEAGFDIGYELRDLQSLRHKMHVTNDLGEWLTMLDDVRATVDELRNVLPDLDITDVPQCEDIACDGHCEECMDLESEFLSDHKEKTNSAIEEWMRNFEKEFGLDEDTIAPSGMARIRWMESA